MKKWTARIGIAVLLIQSMGQGSPVFADTFSVEQKADVLNQVHILTGDGNSYNLTGKLRRSEAAAFVVKALGMQNTVLQQKDVLSQTSFKDVPKTEWFAPYVGYMIKQNIVTGYPDGTFKPNEYVSEKAFFSMVLKAMGYTGSDFEWNTVNKVAFEAGLVDDIMYVFKETDRADYKRGDVVSTLYAALGKPLKNQEKKMIQLLIDNQMVSADKAESFGFVKIDRLPTAIKSLKVLSSSQIAVTFNEEIVVPSVDQIQIALKSDPAKKLQVKNLLWNVDTLTIDMEQQADRQSYTIEFPNIKDTQGNQVALLKNEFVGYNTPELVSPYFKMAKIEAINQKTINVYFTHPVSEKADLELLYDFYAGDNKWIEGGFKTLGIKRHEDKKNLVTLSLKEGVFVPGTTYTLKIKGDLKSAYNINLNKGEGDSISFLGVVGTPITAQLTSAYSQEGMYVYLQYSQIVDKLSASKAVNYSVKEKDTGRLLSVQQVYAMKSLDQIDKGFVLKTESLSVNKSYEVTARGVYDTYKTEQLPEMKVSFEGTATVGEDIKLEAALALNKNLIVAVFNRELKDASINASVGMEGGPIIVMKELDPENPRYLRLYVSAATPMQVGKVYPLKFYTGVYDYMDKSNYKTLETQVVGNDVARTALGITSANFVDESTILLKFNQPIHKTLNNALGKYEIFYSDGKTERLMLPASAEFATDQVVLLKLPYLMQGGSFRIQARDILDVSGQFSTPILNAEVK